MAVALHFGGLVVIGMRFALLGVGLGLCFGSSRCNKVCSLVGWGCGIGFILR